MDVSVSGLRAELKTWIERAKDGEEVVVTERGLPVARLSGIEGADLVAGLLRDGILTAPTEERPSAPSTAGNSPKSANAVSGLVRRLRR
jgi:prevent-host-death family protein